MAKLNELHLQTVENSTNSGEIVLYQPNETIRLEVRMENETVWLTQAQMADLFQTTRNNITLHIGNIFKENELNKNSVCKDFLLTASDGKTYKTKIYNLDVIISVGYRVKSQRGTQFRIWANQVLKQYPQKTIQIRKYKENFHDRFLIIDDIVYHFGASFKDLGKRLFAFNKMGLSKENILKMVND